MKKGAPTESDNSEFKERLTREAMADVDAGRVVDHRAVLAWAESLGYRLSAPAASDKDAIDQAAPGPIFRLR
jgi:hypothetical protein